MIPLMNKVTHFEIPFDDVNRAQKFYQNVFGWQIREFPELDYWMATTCETDSSGMKPKDPGAINGGFLKRDATGEAPIIVIDVSNIEEHLQKIEAAGGKVTMPKTQVGQFGLYARVKDTEGNTIGIWQNLQQ